jgi:predicted amino acid dehydrogenase
LRVLAEQKLLGFVIAGHLLRVENIRVAPTLSSHETLRVEPSAYIGHTEIDQFIQAFRRVCAHIARADAGKLCEFMLPDTKPREGSQVTGGEAPAREGQLSTPARKIAFLAHFRDGKDLPLFDPGFRPYSEAACEDFLCKTSPVLDPFVLASRRIGSPSGTSVDLNVIVVPFTASQASAALRSGDGDRLLAMLAAAVALATEGGATLVGCGAYTSILSDNCRQLARPGVGLTSGNSLTVAAAVQALDQVAGELGLRRRILGVVGATGNIGATLAEVAADDVDEVVLVGRPGAASRLTRVAARIKKPVRIESSLEALRGCNMIATASNSAVPIIRPEHIGDEPVVVCDVAVPADVMASVSVERPNARVVRGGLLKLPDGQDLQIRALDLPDRHVYACLAETLVLGLSGMDKMFSFGPLRPEKVRLIRSLAAHHGFTVDAKLGGN